MKYDHIERFEPYAISEANYHSLEIINFQLPSSKFLTNNFQVITPVLIPALKTPASLYVAARCGLLPAQFTVFLRTYQT